MRASVGCGLGTEAIYIRYQGGLTVKWRMTNLPEPERLESAYACAMINRSSKCKVAAHDDDDDDEDDDAGEEKERERERERECLRGQLEIQMSPS